VDSKSSRGSHVSEGSGQEVAQVVEREGGREGATTTKDDGETWRAVLASKDGVWRALIAVEEDLN